MTAKTPLIAIVFFLATLLLVSGIEPTTEASESENKLIGRNVAILIAQGFHDAETVDPKEHLSNLGASVTVIGPEVGIVGAYNSNVEVEIEKAVADVSIDDFDALIIPGGDSPGVLREIEAVVDFVRGFFNAGKVVAAICHGPQVLVTADVLDGYTATCFHGMSDELIAAGAEYVNEPVVVDGHLITSRLPDDIPVFNEAISEALMWLRKTVSHWRLNEKAGTTIYDGITDGIDGTLINMDDDNWIEGVKGTALSFDGTNEYVELDSGLDKFRGGFSVALWAYPTDVKTRAKFIDFGNGQEDNNITFGRYESTDDLYFQVFDGNKAGDYVIASDAIDLNEWQFFVATVDRLGNAKLYKDGQVIAEGNTFVPSTVLRTQNFIGRSNWAADEYYEGAMHDIRVFNYALTEDEIAGIFDSERKLLHHWRLDDEAAWDWDDDSSWAYIEDSANAETESYIKTGADQIFRDIVEFGEPGATSQTDTSIKFGGRRERAKLGPVAPEINDFTIMFWFKLENHRPQLVQSSMLSANANQPGGWSVRLWGDSDFLDGNNGKPRLDFFHEGNDNITLIDAVEENRWYNVMLTRDSTYSLNIYVDEELVHSGINAVRFENADNDAGVWLAMEPSGEGSFCGWLDDVRIYNYAVDDIPDFTGNERVGTYDLEILVQFWLEDDCGVCKGADINLDGKVDFTDFAIFAEYWLTEKD